MNLTAYRRGEGSGPVAPRASHSRLPTVQKSLEHLDLATVIKLSQAVSGEMALVALPTKHQKPPHRIKFLQERLDHSWDVQAIGQAFALMCATQESGAGV